MTHRKLRRGHRDLRTLPTHVPADVIRNIALSAVRNYPPRRVRTVYHCVLRRGKLGAFIGLGPALLKCTHIHRVLSIYNFNCVNLGRRSFSRSLGLARTLRVLRHLVTLTGRGSLNFNMGLAGALNAVGGGNTLPNRRVCVSNHTLFPLSVGITTILSHTFSNGLPVSCSNNTDRLAVHSVFSANVHPVAVTASLLGPNNCLHLDTYVHRLRNSST